MKTTKKIKLIAPEMSEVEKLCSELAQKRASLASTLTEMAADKAQIELAYAPKIRRLADAAAGVKALLQTAILSAKSLFEKPRTREFSGIKVGFRKGTGKINWDDADTVVARIRKFMPEKADLLIITKEVPNADTLTQLDAKDLARIGARIEGTGDLVVINLNEPAIDKQVKQLIAERSEDGKI